MVRKTSTKRVPLKTRLSTEKTPLKTRLGSRKSYTPSSPLRVELLARNASLSEIYSGKMWQCAFVAEKGGKYVQAHSFARCKDFLNDIVYAEINNKPIEIYSLTFDPKVGKILQSGKIRMLVRNEATTDSKVFEENNKKTLSLLHIVEAEMGLSKSVLRKVADSDKHFVFESDANWAHSTVMLSLYSIILRAGKNFDPKFKTPLAFFESLKGKAGEGHDEQYVKAGLESGYLKFILEKGRRVFGDNIKNNFSFGNLSEAHNAGLQTLSYLLKNNRDRLKQAPYKSWIFPE